MDRSHRQPDASTPPPANAHEVSWRANRPFRPTTQERMRRRMRSCQPSQNRVCPCLHCIRKEARCKHGMKKSLRLRHESTRMGHNLVDPAPFSCHVERSRDICLRTRRTSHSRPDPSAALGMTRGWPLHYRYPPRDAVTHVDRIEAVGPGNRQKLQNLAPAQPDKESDFGHPQQEGTRGGNGRCDRDLPREEKWIRP